MRNRKILTLVLGAVLVIAASAGVLAGLGGDDNGGAVDLDVNNGRPGGGTCNCPLNYDPVVCKVPGPDGSTIKQLFSNSCFAGCAGATECAGIVSPD